jgi:G:T/U-mismatch repair DNA glycosylase
MWKLATPVLAGAVVLLVIERRQQRRRAEGLWRSIEAYRNEQADLVCKLAEAKLDAAEAMSIANILRHRDEATCPCSEVKAAEEHITYLTERNNRLTLALLANSGDLLARISRN